MFKNVLVGVKETLPALPLLDLARCAAPAPAHMHLVTLIRVGTSEDEPQRLRRAQETLAGLVEVLQRDGYDASFDTNFIAVAAAVDLLEIAESRQTDLIVIGLAKRSRVAKALMGSDAQRILLGASSPVLAARLYD